MKIETDRITEIRGGEYVTDLLHALNLHRPEAAICGVIEKRGKLTILVDRNHPAFAVFCDEEWGLGEIRQKALDRWLRMVVHDHVLAFAGQPIDKDRLGGDGPPIRLHRDIKVKFVSRK